MKDTLHRLIGFLPSTRRTSAKDEGRPCRTARPLLRHRISKWLKVCLVPLSCVVIGQGKGWAALTIIGTHYQEDRMFPEFDCYWNGGNYPNPCPTNHAGANLHVYLKNTGPSSVTITDATLAGYNLETVIKMVEVSSGHFLSSIYFYWDNPPQAILDAGEPIWWKADPPVVPAGGVAQVTVRVRYIPTTPTVTVGVVNSGGSTLVTNLTVDANTPRITGIGYSEDRTKVYLHWRRPDGASSAAPASVLLDGTNVTAFTTTVGDPSVPFAASVISLPNPLGHFSYHVYQGLYADGKVAAAGQRAWTNKFIYATYCKFDNLDCNQWLAQATAHGFNNIQMNLCGMCLDSSVTSTGYGYTIMDIGKLQSADPDMWFLNDEPDSEESNQAANHCNTGLNIPCDYRKYPGTLVMYEAVDHAATLRAHRPNVPTTVNLDGAEEPWSFYDWGGAVDILQSDNYYEPRMKGAYQVNFNRIPLYNKAKVSFAIARTMSQAAEPNPSNHLLYSTEQTDWPYPDWRSKRFEVYYSLAGGSKGMGYWWLQPPRGMNNTDAASQLLWKEVGLCGNEIKIARDLIVHSTPVDLELAVSSALGQASGGEGAGIWVRGAASGIDALILYMVNDNYASDIAGCHVTNVFNASVTVTLPSWLAGAMAFEVTPGGLKPVSISLTADPAQLQLNLGTLTLTKMIVLTSDAQIPLALQQRYLAVVRSGVCTFASEYCGNSAPVVVVQPRDQVVLAGSNATFVVTANGWPTPSYQWRFRSEPDGPWANLSGATGASYTRVNAQVSHDGGYAVIINNSQGSVTSVVARLTVSTNGFPPSIVTPPASQSVELGEDASFTVLASGSPAGPEGLGYQWRFNGGVLAGATGTAYTRTNAQFADQGNYDVVVSNGSGSITSAPGVLLVTLPCPAAGLLNGSFEGTTNANGVATGWTGYQRAPNPTTVWTIQINQPPAGAGTYYQQIANTSSTGGGGVRQDITGCTAGATYSVAGWFRGNSASATCTVKVSPMASTSWATAEDLSPPQMMNGASWLPFSGTVVATGTTMTLWLDGQTGGAGLNKAECFDGIVVTCESMPAQPPAIAQQPSSQSIETGGNASFTVQAYGSGELGYRWQRSSTNLNDGGHLSGVFTPTLNITGADGSDAGNYRCVVTNAVGSTNSATATLTVTNAAIPPGITQHPANQSVIAGGMASFTVSATGSGTLYYQWQKNSGNLGESGHYSGVFTPTLTVTGADTNDAANYRCVVTNTYGSTNSAAASLTVTQVSFACLSVLNADFEGGYSLAGGGYIADNWTEWETDPDAVIGYEETTITHTGGHSQRIRVSGGASGTSGGVYQRVPVTAGQACFVSIWAYAGDNLTTCSLGVDPAGGTNASAGVTWTIGTSDSAWTQQSWTGTATADYLTVFCRVTSTDDVKRNGYFDDLSPAVSNALLQLTVQHNGNMLTLTWPECPNARLEWTGSLSPPLNWATVTDQVSVAAGRKSVTITPTGNAGYYRLALD